MNYTREEVVRAYQLLNEGQTAEIKKQADDYLNEFMQSAAAWSLSRDLMVNSTNVEVRFVGAYVLYKKILNDYSSLAKADRAQLVTFLGDCI